MPSGSATETGCHCRPAAVASLLSVEHLRPVPLCCDDVGSLVTLFGVDECCDVGGGCVVALCHAIIMP